MKKKHLILSIAAVAIAGIVLLRLTSKDQKAATQNAVETTINGNDNSSFSVERITLEPALDPEPIDIPSSAAEYADPAEVTALTSYFLEIDPSLSNDLRMFILDPDRMPASVFSNFLSMASGWEVREKMLPDGLSSNAAHKARIPTRTYKKYNDDTVAAEAFQKNLQQREQSYETIEPAEGMVPVQDAVAAATEACPVEFDSGQKPKVNLIRNFYLVFLWEHRRPYTDGTYHAAAITIDAYTGEVLTVQVREDLNSSRE